MQQSPQEILAKNPVYQNTVNYINTHGGDAKSAFYNACQERGVNPNDILNALRGGFRNG